MEEDAAVSTHGCDNNSDSEEDGCSDSDFGTSELGTKAYSRGRANNTSQHHSSRRWEETYQKELETFKDVGDVGEIWFGEESMSRVLRWMDKAKIPENAAILDIGTGNGAFLVELEMDFLHCQSELKGFDVCIDKGTFDAISLNPNNTTEGKKHYTQALKDVLKENGLFAITSCNWTKEQLLERFSDGFEFVEELPTPRFQFGGKTGNSVTALIFRRVH
ncbi:EEF1A lysine methyltransferase 2 isoform 3-T3 [Pholidichthys leucotaenia]